MRMNHEYIAEQDLVGRYVAGTLPFDERARFEAHFVDCPRCLDALEDVAPFQNALRAFAAEESVTRTVVAARTAIETAPALAAPPQMAMAPARRWPVWVFRTAALAAVVFIAVGVVGLARLERRLARATAIGEIAERQLGESEQRIRELMARNAARADRPQVSAPFGALVFPLVKARGVESEASQNRVTLVGSPAWVVLLADFYVRPTSNRYRATLNTVAGVQVWSDDRLTASSADSIAVGVPSTVLAGGDYVLWLEEAASSNAWRPAGHYTFRVVTQVR
jgi:hypothetical protein